MEDSIIQKINFEILGGITKECQVVYIMVELRKLLDRQRGVGIDNFKIIRFYSDWTVHTQKDRVTNEIKEMMERMDREIPMDCHTNQSWMIQNKEHVKFIYMETLIAEMDTLFAEMGINRNLLAVETQRLNFIALLIKILEDQPINNPIRNIKRFYFEPANERCTIWIIEFNDARGLCRFGNKMFISQKNRFFPLPDYDLASGKVKLTILGKVLDVQYARKLVQIPDLDLKTIIALDKVQKRKKLNVDEIVKLKKLDLIEGRNPNFYISSKVAVKTGEKSGYIKMRGFKDDHYKKLILEFLEKYNEASKQDIEELILDLLPKILDIQQKKNKIRNIVYSMSKRDKTITNKGTSRYPKWRKV